MKILDVNLLLYAIDAASPHHAAARNFLLRAVRSDETIAVPWVVTLAFLRLSTLRRAGQTILPLEEALEFVDTLMASPNVTAIAPGPRHWAVLRELLVHVGVRGNLVMDAHLAALAIENGAELCSADTDFARFPRLRWTDPTRAAT